jgi:hypothetical protein
MHFALSGCTKPGLDNRKQAEMVIVSFPKAAIASTLCKQLGKYQQNPINRCNTSR